MHPSEAGAFLSGLGDWMSQMISAGSGPTLQLKSWIVEHFGANGLIAAVIVAGVFAFFLITQLVRLLISTVKYLVIPAIVLAFIATLLLPVSFYSALPVTATICSVFLLFKG